MSTLKNGALRICHTCRRRMSQRKARRCALAADQPNCRVRRGGMDVITPLESFVGAASYHRTCAPRPTDAAVENAGRLVGTSLGRSHSRSSSRSSAGE